jgi:transposase
MTLLEALANSPGGQRRAALALVGGRRARTYREAAALLGLHVGTIYRHLYRLRRQRPEAYAAVMAVRAGQLAERHAAAVNREGARSAEWHRRQAARRYYYRFGRWPWERRR